MPKKNHDHHESGRDASSSSQIKGIHNAFERGGLLLLSSRQSQTVKVVKTRMANSRDIVQIGTAEVVIDLLAWETTPLVR